MRKVVLKSILFLAFLLVVHSCRQQTSIIKSMQNNGVVTLDTEMEKRLFPEGKNMLIGSDGAISIKIDDERSFWLFGDSFFGETADNKWDRETTLFIMGNIWMLLDKDAVKLISGDDASNPGSLLKPEKIDNNHTVLWPMHGFVQNEIVHVFLSTIVFTGTEPFDFYWHSTIYYRLNLHDMSVIDSEMLLTKDQTNAHFGFGIHKHDGYYYSYGSIPKDDLTSALGVSRAQLINDKLVNWEFYNGNSWVKNAMESAALKGVDIPISEQFSVFKHNGKFVLLTQDRFNPEIYTFISDNPTGPWTNKKHHYTIPEARNPLLFTYNAMAHSQYVQDDKLLVSYCVNAWNPEDLYDDATIYKPRFISIPFNRIFK